MKPLKNLSYPLMQLSTQKLSKLEWLSNEEMQFSARMIWSTADIEYGNGMYVYICLLDRFQGNARELLEMNWPLNSKFTLKQSNLLKRKLR